MPELPEAETVRRGLQTELVGRRVDSFEVTAARTIRRQLGLARNASAGDHPELRRASAAVDRVVRGQEVLSADRYGKYLGLGLGGARVVIHLGMSGQLLLVEADRPLALHTHALFGFDDGRELRFVDPRTFGEIFLTGDEPWPPPTLAGMGPDPLIDFPDRAEFARRLGGRRGALKTLLTDQRFLAGIGNIYSDEILFAARLRPDRRAEGLSRPAVTRLHQAVPEILQAAVERGGSTLADGGYVDLYGRPGTAQLHHAVHAREGQTCIRCGGTVRRRSWGARSAYFCPACQK